MTDTEMARTFAEAEAQSFTVPPYQDWATLAHLIDGYAIAEELGIMNWPDWLEEQEEKLETNPDALTVLDVRMILFFTARKLRHSMTFDPRGYIDYLLQVIAQKSGQHYTPLTDEEKR